jgi:hypothetical protein
MRLLSPPGFMPTFAHGGVTITICPDEAPPTPMSGGHHDGHSKSVHRPCPYASAASFGTADSNAPLLTALVAAELAPVIARPFAFLDRSRPHERPPLRGPPIPA